MDLDLFREILEMESSSGTERRLAEFLERRLTGMDKSCRCERFEVGDGTLNLLFSWGSTPPEVVLCSHLDTVPPYISPSFKEIRAGTGLPDGTVAQKDDILICGRGSCDAKGQFFAMWSALTELAPELRGRLPQGGRQAVPGFGLLLLAGEETGSYGAKAYTRDCPGGEWLIVGEPTDNRMASASKGTKSFNVTIHGKPCHSGYPELGVSAVDRFLNLVNRLKTINFPVDAELGETTWNIGMLRSDNPQNILSGLLTFRLYFRTTFATDEMVRDLMTRIGGEGRAEACVLTGNAAATDGTASEKYIEIDALGGDVPMRYDTFDGYESKPVAFGSDTPRMTKFTHRSLCGPGSISVAHTDREYVLASSLEKAKCQYKDMINRIFAGNMHGWCPGRKSDGHFQL